MAAADGGGIGGWLPWGMITDTSIGGGRGSGPSAVG